MPSPPGDLPDPGIEPVSLKSPALAGRSFTTSATWEAQMTCNTVSIHHWCELTPLSLHIILISLLWLNDLIIFVSSLKLLQT